MNAYYEAYIWYTLADLYYTLINPHTLFTLSLSTPHPLFGTCLTSSELPVQRHWDFEEHVEMEEEGEGEGELQQHEREGAKNRESEKEKEKEGNKSKL